MFVYRIFITIIIVSYIVYFIIQKQSMEKFLEKIREFAGKNRKISYTGFLLLALMIDAYMVNLPNIPYAFSYILSSFQSGLFSYELLTEILFIEGVGKNKMYVTLILMIIIYVAIIYLLRGAFKLANVDLKPNWIKLFMFPLILALVLSVTIWLSMLVTNKESREIMELIYTIFGVGILLVLLSDAETKFFILFKLQYFIKKGTNITIFCCTFLLVGTSLSLVEGSDSRLFYGTKPTNGYFYVNENKSLINSIYYSLKIPDDYKGNSNLQLSDVMRTVDDIRKGGYMLGYTCLLGETDTKYYVTTFRSKKWCGNLENHKVVTINKRQGLAFVFGHMTNKDSDGINKGLLVSGKKKKFLDEDTLWESLSYGYSFYVTNKQIMSSVVPYDYFSTYDGVTYIDKLRIAAYREIINKGEFGKANKLNFLNQIEIRSEEYHDMLLEGKNNFLEEYYVKYEELESMLKKYYESIDVKNEEAALLYLSTIFNRDIYVKEGSDLDNELSKNLPEGIEYVFIYVEDNKNVLKMVTKHNIRYIISVAVSEREERSGAIFNISSLEDNISIENPDIYY